MSKKTTATTNTTTENTNAATAQPSEATARQTAQQTVNDLITKVNDALDNGNIAEATEAKTEFTAATEALNAEIKAEEFVNILACEAPAFEACKRGFIDLATVKTDPTTKKVSQGAKVEIIDLAEIQQNTTTQITVNAMWGIFSEALNHAVLNYLVEVQGITEKSSRLAKFKIGKGAGLLGITNADMETIGGIKKAMQKVIDTIIEGQTVTEKQANAFLLNYSKWSHSINGVSMATESTFRRQLMRIMYQMVNGTALIAE